MTETELKFQVPAARSAAVRRALATSTAQTLPLQAIYFDTPGQRLASAGLALRLRREGRRWVQTLKGRGDGLMQRLEHEVPLPARRESPSIDPARHDGTPLGAALRGVLGTDPGDALQALYRTDIQRVLRRVRHAGAWIEVAHDRGRIVAGDRVLAVDELEFELLSGPPAALPALAARWAARHGLWWDVRTKSERGCRLALGVDRVPAVTAQALSPDDLGDAASGWRAMLLAALAQALPNAAELAAGSGADDHLHQLRLALRRLRTALGLFAAWGGDAMAAADLEQRWAAAFSPLGAARDSDVLQSLWLPRLASAGAPPLAAEPVGNTAAPGDALIDAPAAWARHPVTTALLLQTLQVAVAAPDDSAAQTRGAALRDSAAAALRQAWKRAWADAGPFATADTAQRHRARKRLKRLRYGLESVRSLFAPRAVRRQLRALDRALRALGDYNDLQVARAHFAQRAISDPAAWFAVGWLAAQHDAALQRALKTLAALRDAPRVWRRG